MGINALALVKDRLHLLSFIVVQSSAHLQGTVHSTK